MDINGNGNENENSINQQKKLITKKPALVRLTTEIVSKINLNFKYIILNNHNLFDLTDYVIKEIFDYYQPLLLYKDGYLITELQEDIDPDINKNVLNGISYFTNDQWNEIIKEYQKVMEM